MKLFSLLIAVSLTTISFGQIDKDKIATTQKFDEVITYISKLYVDDVNDEQLTDAAIVALLEKTRSSLDFYLERRSSGSQFTHRWKFCWNWNSFPDSKRYPYGCCDNSRWTF